jgi:hypothetical protein
VLITSLIVVLNKLVCRHVKKLVMANEIARLGGLILFLFKKKFGYLE